MKGYKQILDKDLFNSTTTNLKITKVKKQITALSYTYLLTMFVYIINILHLVRMEQLK